MACCITEIDTCLTHGATYVLDVNLTLGYEDARADGFTGQLMFLDYEGGTVLLTLTSPISLDNLMQFTATPAQTAALPPYGPLFYYVQISVQPTEVQRLFQGSVTVNL